MVCILKQFLPHINSETENGFVRWTFIQIVNRLIISKKNLSCHAEVSEFSNWFVVEFCKIFSSQNLSLFIKRGDYKAIQF